MSNVNVFFLPDTSLAWARGIHTAAQDDARAAEWDIQRLGDQFAASHALLDQEHAVRTAELQRRHQAQVIALGVAHEKKLTERRMDARSRAELSLLPRPTVGELTCILSLYLHWATTARVWHHLSDRWKVYLDIYFEFHDCFVHHRTVPRTLSSQFAEAKLQTATTGTWLLRYSSVPPSFTADVIYRAMSQKTSNGIQHFLIQCQPGRGYTRIIQNQSQECVQHGATFMHLLDLLNDLAAHHEPGFLGAFVMPDDAGL